ncbi:MAG: DUF5067 domain-containing protein [Oscillospiraceae bacterium]|nr:DUF5067 domain-containing protein [Oscillospiraceae bacterium]
MPFCQNCGHEYQQGAVQCPNCKVFFAQQPNQQNFAPPPMMQQGYPQQPPKKKSGCLLVIAVIVGIGIIGSVVKGYSNAKNKRESPTQSTTQSIVTEAQTKANENPVSSSVQTTSSAPSPKESPIKILKHELQKDRNGNNVLVIEYEFTNQEDSAKSFSTLFTDKVFQNGVECSTAILFDDVDASTHLADILPNTTTTVKEAYVLQDLTKVTVNVKEWIGDAVYLNEEIDLGGGEGVKADTTDKSETSVAISGYRMSKDYKDNDVLIVDYTYHNGEDKPQAFMWLFRAKAYQNGVECDDTVIGCDDLEKSTYSNEIMPGMTVTVSKGYLIKDSTDVQIIITDLFKNKTYLEEKHSLK